MLVTVAICTWNRAHVLEQTLTEMRHLRIPPGVEWELLVVNNRCTDATDEVLARHTGPLPLRRLYEAKQGLAHARNRALAEFRGELLLWTDDDVLVAPDWLQELAAAARAWPQAAFFAGAVRPWFPTPPPRWVEQNLATCGPVWALLDLGPGVRALAEHEHVFGVNMAFRAEAARRYPYDPLLGRCGGGLDGGEETKVIQELRRDGHVGVWVGTALVRHWLPQERLTPRYVWGWNHAQGRRAYDAAAYHNARRLGSVPLWPLRMYVGMRLRALALRLFGSRRWLPCFARAAHFRGLVDAARLNKL